jgi:histidyl-tRNA synthetase
VSQKFAAVKGMNDVLPGEVEVWQFVERTAREAFRRFSHREVRTPVLEDTGLFVRSVGEDTDIVGKEMYTFEDKAGRSVTLRPEGTAPAARAYIEHSVAVQEPVTRWFYLGPMFRYERMKTGRYRQFWQAGAEAYGSKEPAQDVEMLDLVVQLLGDLGLRGVALNVNSLGDEICRPAYTESLVGHLRQHAQELCPDCQARLDRNPLRVLDCKVERCQQIARAAPSVLDFLCQPCAEHFTEVRRKLDLLGLPYEVNPRMVRGLDYYTRTAFEFIAHSPALGTASTVGGGGRYDRLVKGLGGPDVPAVGFALGLDRLCLLIKESGRTFQQRPDLFIASADVGSQDEVLKRVSALRKAGLSVEMDPRGGSLKSQMKRADRSGARYALVLGENERRSGSAELKPMEGGEPLRVRLDQIAQALTGGPGPSEGQG